MPDDAKPDDAKPDLKIPPPPPPMVPPLAESDDLDDLLNEDGTIK